MTQLKPRPTVIECHDLTSLASTTLNYPYLLASRFQNWISYHIAEAFEPQQRFKTLQMTIHTKALAVAASKCSIFSSV